VTVTNDGSDAATDVHLTDTASIALKVVSIDAPDATCHIDHSITCTLGTLDPGRTVKIVVVAEVEASGTEHNTATADSTTKLVDPEDATSTATTKVEPILDTHEKESKTSATTGQNVIYDTTVVNPTTVPIRNVEVCNDLPGGLLFVRSKPAASVHTGQPCWRIHTLRARGKKRFVAVANVAPGTSGRRVDHAIATARGARAGRARAIVKITRALPVPCGVASRAGTTGTRRQPRSSPVAGAAC
jgi:uncharacterized repeat protein (TIGR01451 family)